jgi:hypothetical protein
MSLETYLSSLHQTVPDLTGQVIKADAYPFAYGGYGDVWKGKLVKKYSENFSKVKTYFLAHWHFLILRFLFLQVAVKVVKGLEDPAKTGVRFCPPAEILCFIFFRDSSAKCACGPQLITRISHHCWVSPSISTDLKHPVLCHRIVGMAIYADTSRSNRVLISSHW